MTSLVHADIFFFITTVVVVAVGLLAVVALIYVINILRRANQVVKEIKAETVLVREDIQRFRENGFSHIIRFKNIAGFIKKFFEKKKK